MTESSQMTGNQAEVESTSFSSPPDFRFDPTVCSQVFYHLAVASLSNLISMAVPHSSSHPLLATLAFLLFLECVSGCAVSLQSCLTP